MTTLEVSNESIAAGKRTIVIGVFCHFFGIEPHHHISTVEVRKHHLPCQKLISNVSCDRLFLGVRKHSSRWSPPVTFDRIEVWVVCATRPPVIDRGARNPRSGDNAHYTLIVPNIVQNSPNLTRVIPVAAVWHPNFVSVVAHGSVGLRTPQCEGVGAHEPIWATVASLRKKPRFFIWVVYVRFTTWPELTGSVQF